MTAAKEGTADRNIFPFDDLPPELQVRIIEFTVIDDKPINVTKVGRSEDKNNRLRTLRSAHKVKLEISKVNKRICAEALRAFFRGNEFRAATSGSFDFWELIRWLEAIGPQNRTLIRHLTIGAALPGTMGSNSQKRSQIRTSRLEKLRPAFTEPKGDFGFKEVTFPTQEP